MNPSMKPSSVRRLSSVLPLAALMALTIAVAPAMAQTDRGDAEGKFERTLKVTGPVQLEAKTGSGSIVVRPGEAGTVQIVGRIRAHDRWRGGGMSAEEKVRALEAKPPIEQTGNSIRIGRIEDRELRENVGISYELIVPPDTRLDSHTASGGQTIEGIRGPADTSTGSGSITLTNIGGELRASTGSGSIRASGIAGAVVATTGSGDIEVEQSAPGNVEARTGSGGVEVRGVKGTLRVSTGSGSIRVGGEPTGDWRVRTGSGSITVRLATEIGFELAAHTSSGSVYVKFPITIQGEISKREIRGKVRGGGPLLDISTASGSIRVE